MVTARVVKKDGDTYRVAVEAGTYMPRGISAQRARARALFAEGLINTVSNVGVGKLQRLSEVDFIGETAIGEGPATNKIVDRRYDVTITGDDS